MVTERESMTLNEVGARALGVEERSDETPRARASGARPAPDPEVVAKPKRRQFTAEYRLRILEEADRCMQPGEVGRLLRREGLYTSHLAAWRKARRQGSLRGLTPSKRGARPAERNPLSAKVRELEAKVVRLEKVHPADIAAAHVAALRALERGTHRLTLDCGCGRGWSVRQVLAAVERSAGTPIAVREAPRRRGDVAVSVAHTQAIRHALGWRPRYSELDVMVSTALAWISSLADGRAHGKRHGELVGRTV